MIGASMCEPHIDEFAANFREYHAQPIDPVSNGVQREDKELTTYHRVGRLYM